MVQISLSIGFNLKVSVREILEQQGIRYFKPVNGLFTNWVEQLQMAKHQGLEYRPVRIGTKRVVLSSTQEIPTRRKTSLIVLISLPLLAALIVLIVLIKPNPAQLPKSDSGHCNELSSDQLLVPVDGGFKLHDWSLSLEKVSQIGSIIEFKYIASCGAKSASGELIAIVKGNSFWVKKMAPTSK